MVSFRMFGKEEMELLGQVIEQQDLWRLSPAGFVNRFEDAFAQHVAREYVHAVSSGTAANEAALAAVGVGPGEEVICTPCSFIASSLGAVGLGAVPVFADVDPANMVISAEAIEAAVTPKAKAVVVVHLWGMPADMDPIVKVARKHNLKVVEDCAQAYDVYYRGKMAGTFGDATCYSMQQSKHITAGEGGIVTTDDPEAYARAVLYSNCGMPWYREKLQEPVAGELAGILPRGHFAFGHNNRMTELQGAVALAQLAKIDLFNSRRAEMVRAIEEECRSVPGLLLAQTYPDSKPNYWAYPLALDPRTTTLTKPAMGFGRNAEVNYLEPVYQQMQAERRTSVGYPLPDYVQYKPGISPAAEEAVHRILSFWVHPLDSSPEAIREQARDIAERVRREG